jgi:hypothetical protein
MVVDHELSSLPGRTMCPAGNSIAHCSLGDDASVLLDAEDDDNGLQEHAAKHDLDENKGDPETRHKNADDEAKFGNRCDCGDGAA